VTETLRVRKLADKSVGERVQRFDPVTGEKILVNPATGQPESWPLAGVQVEGDPPAKTRVSTSWVDRGISERWLEGVNGKPVVRPAGARQDVWNATQTARPHVFMHYDEIVVKTIDGDVRYRVTRQPDKYVADGDDNTTVTPEIYATGNTRVDWFYDLELVEG
jgi:hypothetical protein